MVPCEEQAWKRILPKVEDTGADGIELNFGCPHGMSERGMGSAVGQVPEYVEMVTRWCKEHTRLPVIVKLTPNVTNILQPARAARSGGADAVSLVNTISSIMGVDLDLMSPSPSVDGRGAHGGYCGPAIKPIALRMVGEIARDRESAGMVISGIGGISTWRDAAEFMALGAQNIQVCTAAMVYGSGGRRHDRLPQQLDGRKGHRRSRPTSLANRAKLRRLEHLNLTYTVNGAFDPGSVLNAAAAPRLCDTSHQSHRNDKEASVIRVIRRECVGCNLCVTCLPRGELHPLKDSHSGLSVRARVEQSRVTKLPHPSQQSHPV